MSTIWKFTLKALDQQIVMMPRGARLLSVASQHEELCLWALVDPAADKEPRGFVIVGTGHSAPSPNDPLTFVGTVLLHGGSLVLHVFDAGPPPPREGKRP